MTLLQSCVKRSVFLAGFEVLTAVVMDSPIY
jgi:hypothetical protein